MKPEEYEGEMIDPRCPMCGDTYSCDCDGSDIPDPDKARELAEEIVQAQEDGAYAALVDGAIRRGGIANIHGVSGTLRATLPYATRLLSAEARAEKAEKNAEALRLIYAGESDRVAALEDGLAQAVEEITKLHRYECSTADDQGVCGGCATTELLTLLRALEPGKGR